MTLIHRSKKTVASPEAESSATSLALADVQQESAEDRYVREALEKQSAALRAEFRDAEAKRIAQENAAKEKAKADAEWTKKRERIEYERSLEFRTPPGKEECSVCGELVIPDCAYHSADNGLSLCVRNVARAKRAGRLSKDQLEAIAEAGALETGFVFRDCADGGYKKTSLDEAYEHATLNKPNPATLTPEYRPIKHSTPV